MKSYHSEPLNVESLGDPETRSRLAGRRYQERGSFTPWWVYKAKNHRLDGGDFVSMARQLSEEPDKSRRESLAETIIDLGKPRSLGNGTLKAYPFGEHPDLRFLRVDSATYDHIMEAAHEVLATTGGAQ